MQASCQEENVPHSSATVWSGLTAVFRTLALVSKSDVWVPMLTLIYRKLIVLLWLQKCTCDALGNAQSNLFQDMGLVGLFQIYIVLGITHIYLRLHHAVHI